MKDAEPHLTCEGCGGKVKLVAAPDGTLEYEPLPDLDFDFPGESGSCEVCGRYWG